MRTVTEIQENAGDILEEAKEINRTRAEETVEYTEEAFTGGEAEASEKAGKEA